MRYDTFKSLYDWEKILKALADKSRLKIIQALMRQESSVNELANNLSMHNYNLSKHLKILEDNGLVDKRKKGINRICKISEDIQCFISDNKYILNLGCCKFEFGRNL